MSRIQRSMKYAALATALAFGFALGLNAQPQLPPDDGSGGGNGGVPVLTPVQLLGQALFFDAALSSPNGQSCSSCHDAGAGWADPANVRDPLNSPTSEGAVSHLYGRRNAPAVTYGRYAPAFFYDAPSGSYIGGRYWDGRAHDPAAQAKATFLDHLEMNNPGPHQIVQAVRQSAYAAGFEALFGAAFWDDEVAAFERIAGCLAAYQQSHVLNGFTSRYDRYLAGDRTALTARERGGLALFEGRGTCVTCHTSRLGADRSGPLFTSFRYYNIGVPKNPRNPFYDMSKSINPAGHHYVDLGLGGVLGVASENGKFKVPSLRNVALTPPYMHNGVFMTLYDAVMFHNTRDTDSHWGPAEVPGTIATGPFAAGATPAPEGPTLPPDPGDSPGGGAGTLGHLNLSAQEVDQIVAFLDSLSDSKPAQ